jgi:hypothetical protein
VRCTLPFHNSLKRPFVGGTYCFARIPAAETKKPAWISPCGLLVGVTGAGNKKAALGGLSAAFSFWFGVGSSYFTRLLMMAG